MKFKKLNEDFIEEGYVNQYVNRVSYKDPIKQQYADFINDTIWDSLDNIDTLAHSKIDGLPDTVIEADSQEFKNEEDAIYNYVKIKTDNYFANTTNESLEDNDEDGWGEEINDKLHDMFDHVERFMYEIRNTVRGSYTRVDTVNELVDTIRNISAGFDAVADEIEDEEDSLQESLKNKNLNEDIDSNSFIGKPLKDFLKTIDHRTKISIESENGYDEYGGVGNVSGLGGLAHDAQWYLADKTIKDIQIPEDKRFYEYKILIEDCTDEVI